MAALSSQSQILEEKTGNPGVPPLPQASSAHSILEKFSQVEIKFNKNFLITLFQIKGIVEDENDEEDPDPRDTEQYLLLEEAYSKWYLKLQANPKSMEACDRFYNAVKDNHELLMKRDTQLFTIEGDFFSNIFDEPGIDTPYLFDQLRDGLDSDEEQEDTHAVPEEDRDGKDNLWSSLIGLYRLCVLICIYMKAPLVKQIIDLILTNNPDLNQNNIFEKIFKEFKGKRRLRKMIMKLLKGKGDNFADIFNSLQKVIATFGPGVNMDSNMKANMDVAKRKIRSMFDGILESAHVTNLDDAQKDRLINALEEKKGEVLDSMVEEKVITNEQVSQVKSLYHSEGLDKLNFTKVFNNLGDTMGQIMEAIESNDEDAVRKVLEETGAGINLDSLEFKSMQEEMENFEQEEVDDDDDLSEISDDDDDDDVGELAQSTDTVTPFPHDQTLPAMEEVDVQVELNNQPSE